MNNNTLLQATQMEVEEDQENLASLPMVTSRWNTEAGDTN